MKLCCYFMIFWLPYCLDHDHLVFNSHLFEAQMYFFVVVPCMLRRQLHISIVFRHTLASCLLG